MDVCNKLSVVQFEGLNVSLGIVKRLKAVCPNLKRIEMNKGIVDSEAVYFVLEMFDKFEKMVLRECEVKEEIRLLKKPKLDIQ